MNLTSGFIASLSNNTHSSFKNTQVILAVYDAKVLKSGQTVDNSLVKYRMTLFDGVSSTNGMVIAPETHQLVMEGKIRDGALISVTQFAVNVIQEKQYDVFEYLTQSSIPHPGSGMGSASLPVAAPMASASNMSAPNQYHSNSNSFSAPGNSKSSTPFSSHKKPPQQWASPTHTISNSVSAVSLNSGPRSNLILFKDITPFSGKWACKAKIVSKGNIKTFTNAKGEGKLLPFVLMDMAGDEIRATAFGAAADKWNANLEDGKMYIFTNCQVKVGNPTYSKHAYDLTFAESTEITPCADDGNAPEVSIGQTTPISEIPKLAVNSNIDILAVVTQMGALTIMNTKKGPSDMRRVTLADNSSKTVELTLWGANALSFSEDKIQLGTVVLLKGTRTGEFGGAKTVSGFDRMVVAPNHEKAVTLQNWYESVGKSGAMENLSEKVGGVRQDQKKTTKDVLHMAGSEKPEYFVLDGVVTWIKRDESRQLWYQACSNEVPNNGPKGGMRKCNKKVTQSDGSFVCDKCNISLDRCDYNWTLTVGVSDPYGNAYISLFGAAGDKFIGKTAEEMNRIQIEDPSMFDFIIQSALYKHYMVKCSLKAEVNQTDPNGGSRVKISALEFSPVDFANESKQLLKELKDLL